VCASRIAALLLLRLAISPQVRASLAVSGGSTPAKMLATLANHPVPWHRVDVTQVDERIAPRGSADRNVEQLDPLKDAGARLWLLPVDSFTELSVPRPTSTPEVAHVLQRATVQLHRIAPTGLDVVHLGLGDDGHTASLVPGDTVLDVESDGIALCGIYRGFQRLTLTFAALNRANRIVWLASGATKAAVIPRLIAGDMGIPAGRVRQDRAELWTDSVMQP
jgi:6-phosphogluconolactonase